MDYLQPVRQSGHRLWRKLPKDPKEPLLNTWEHYAATYDRTTGAAAVYRNGVQVATGTFQQPPRGARWVFGHHSDLNIHVDSLHGKLDDLRIYDVILSAEEIRTLAGFPVSSPDSYTIREDGTLTVAGPGVLANDDHGLDLPITAVQDSPPAHGTLALSATGAFTYTPAANYSGPDSFTYHATDGTLNGPVTTVSLTVTSVNDPPSFTKGQDQSTTDGQLVIPSVIGFDGLSGLTGQGEPFLPYTEDGFKVTPGTGVWMVFATTSPSGVVGNPAPSDLGGDLFLVVGSHSHLGRPLHFQRAGYVWRWSDVRVHRAAQRPHGVFLWRDCSDGGSERLRTHRQPILKPHR